MKYFSTLSLKRLNNGAHFLFVSDILARAEADATVSVKAATQVANFKTAVEQEDEDLKLSSKSLYTDDIAAADKERDKLYNSYKRMVQSYLNFSSEDIAKAAKVLNQHLIDYAINTQMQLNSETGMLVNLLTDLEGKYAEQVDTLSLKALVEQLKAANERVRTATASRTEERMNVPAAALRTARSFSDEAYKALTDMVESLATVEGEADYADFIEYVNTEISQYKRAATGRRSSGSSHIPAEPMSLDEPPAEESREDRLS